MKSLENQPLFQPKLPSKHNITKSKFFHQVQKLLVGRTKEVPYSPIQTKAYYTVWAEIILKMVL